MGKVEDMRALREALRNVEAGKVSPKQAGKGITGASITRVIRDEVATFPSELCGHRSMGNKACIREKDHTEKNHRYAKAPKEAK